MRYTEIQCTIGPSCNDVKTLVGLIKAGATGMRINLSHGSAESQSDKLKNFRKAVEITENYGCSIMYDLRGPEIRVKDIPGGSIFVEDGDTLTVHCENEGNRTETGTADGICFGNIISVNCTQLAERVSVGTEILIDDGKIRLIVEDVSNMDIICHVDRGGNITGHKGVNLPDTELTLDYLGEDDRSDLMFCIRNNVDYVAGSFIRQGEDVAAIRQFLYENGGENIGIIAKIETREAVRNIDSIITEADQILIARGDLGVEIGIEKIPGIQKYIVEKCNEEEIAVIIATELISSMTDCPVPTRAEVCDIANAVYDGASDLLVTGETASGKYPVRVIEYMDRIITQAEADMRDKLIW